MVTVAVYPIILLISHFTPFFSLSSLSAKPTHTYSLPHHLLLPLIHTNTPTQTNNHRDAQNPPSLTVSQNLQEHHHQTQIPPSTPHRPTIATQTPPPPAPSPVKTTTTPKPVKTTETQNP